VFRQRPVLAVLLFGFLLLAIGPLGANGFPQADEVVVRKTERRLELVRDDRVLKSFDIALGLEPAGHKRQEGDSRTPEGRYRLIERNTDSDFFLSILISYPNADDRRQARTAGVPPGGQIMIHGQPNRPKHNEEFYRLTDWTDGCIAVSNSDMVDIWLMTSADTPITILP
jgi:murein L,D-transpeptidase YafK